MSNECKPNSNDAQIFMFRVICPTSLLVTCNNLADSEVSGELLACVGLHGLEQRPGHTW